MSTVCIDCGHRHRGANECPHCDCVWEAILILEDSKMKKIWKKIVGWLFSWQK